MIIILQTSAGALGQWLACPFDLLGLVGQVLKLEVTTTYATICLEANRAERPVLSVFSFLRLVESFFG